jgi:hypothetical protein
MMRRLLVLVTALIVSVMTPVAHAGSSTNVALGLAAFAVFNHVVATTAALAAIGSKRAGARPPPMMNRCASTFGLPLR